MRCAQVVFSVAVVSAMAAASSASMVVSGSLSTPAGDGLIGGDRWAAVPPPASARGFEITWEVSQNGDGTWHYEYELLNDMSDPLSPAVSHAIFQLSENISPDDIFNLGGNAVSTEFGTLGPGPGNPGIPGSIFGFKIETDGVSPTTLSFDSTRAPMWGDFYAKGGSASFAYNVHFGVAVANPNDFKNPALDASGNTLFKILVPDTIPTPGATALLAAAGLVAGRRRR
jgi:hypothetical protein